ncbi:kinase-like domain-containing protein [Trichoderma chlorosporum]
MSVTNDNDDENDTNKYPRGFNKGYYHIGFYPDKSQRQEFWTIGTGYKSEPVDIQLRPRNHFSSSKDCFKHISPKHARISIHPISGFLMIENLSAKPVVCTGYKDDGDDDNGDNGDGNTTRALIINKGDTYVLHKRVTQLKFGELSFNVKFDRFNHEKFIKLRNKYIAISQKSLPMQVINPFVLLDDTTQPSVHTIATIAEVYGSLSCGLNLRTGVPYVIKHSILEPNQPTRQREYNLMMAFSKLESPYLIPTVVDQRSHQHGIVTYVMRMALFSIHSYLTITQNTVTNFEVVRYARDTLEGLHFLHGKNIIHGNINPHTLLLLPNSRDGMPSRMHAAICPIVKRASNRSQRFERPRLEAFSKEDDIRALGAAWLWCFTMNDNGIADNGWEALAQEETRYGEILDIKFSNMLESMMTDESSRRPTCQQLLNNTFWASLEKKRNSRKRKREIKGDGQRKKDVTNQRFATKIRTAD